ncbi:MAG: right-handed parallel beta-helix repeat-containing protein [Candidatus Hydrogenedentes bacterium]|nr:right-handed parallel beta-helix repeat-containing protein [Candidatus Hydrogenedentota bacterium]
MAKRYTCKAHLILFGLCALVNTAASTAPLTLHVAPNGVDTATGASADDALATLTGARDRLRTLRPEGKLDEGAIVQIAAGAYALTAPVEFTPADSGTEDAPILFRGAGTGQTIFSGGRAITGWKQEGKLWVADLPDVKSGAWHFSALWINGDRRQPARTPNATHPWGDEPTDDDFLRTVGPVKEKNPQTGEEVSSSLKFQYREGDLPPFDRLDGAHLVIFHSWESSLMPVKSIDTAGKIVEFTGPARWPYCQWQADQRYYIEHYFDGLDRPGEWYLNKNEGKLYYMPLPGERPESITAIAPGATNLLVLAGDPANGAFVDHLAFEDLTLAHTEYGIAPEGHSDSQAAFKVDAAVMATGARHCRFERCDIKHLGNYGVWFRSGSQHNALRQCELYDLGAGGVRIGEDASPATENEAADHNTVDNCYLHEGGRIFRSAVGVFIARSSHNKITHNEIADFRYTGVSVGWSWGYDPSSANHNIIADNHIHHIGRGQLNDMGGIYCLGVSPGTELTGNVIHTVLSHPRLYGGWGLYTDEGSSGILLKNNLVYHTRTGAFHQHYGEDNRVENNIFAFSIEQQLQRSREEDHNSFFFERNLVYYNNGWLLGSTWKNNNWKMDYNCYWDTSGAIPDFRGGSFADWQAAGFDTHGAIADPGFVDAEHGDFRLKPDSPALALGFVPFDFSKAGLYGDPAWVKRTEAFAHEPFTAPPMPKPEAIADGFEQEPDSPAQGANTLGETDAARIRTTEGIARTGKSALRFADAAGLSSAFNPHLVYAPRCNAGAATAKFSVYLEPGATFYHEWRDAASPYRVGPSLWFHPDGRLVANGKEIATLPFKEWVDLTIACPLGKAANGAYSLTLGGGKPIEGLPCGSPDFYRLDWFGFVSNTDGPSTVYVDDLALGTDRAIAP